MDQAKEKEFNEKIEGLQTQLKELADAKKAADEAKVKAETETADVALRAEITAFVEAQRKEGRYTKAMDDAKVPELMFQLAKSSATVEFADGKKSLLDMFKAVLGSAPKAVVFEEIVKEPDHLGKAKDFQPPAGGMVDEGKLLTVMAARQYVADHAEYKGMEQKVAVAKVLEDAVNGKITLTV
jgi:hypothetical protein